MSLRARHALVEDSEVARNALGDGLSFVATQLHAEGADVTTAQAVPRHQSPQTTLRHYRAAQMDLVRGATVELGQRIGVLRSD